MQKARLAWAMAIFLFLGGMGLGLPAAQASMYLGQVTWTVAATAGVPSIPPPFTVVAAISRINTPYFMLQGIADGNQGISGGGAIIGDELVLTLHVSSAPGNSRNGNIINVRLNRTTLNGTFFSVGTAFDTVGSTFISTYTAGTMTVVGSPVPLTASSAPADLLLLD